MSTRTRAMAVDGHSVDADLLADYEKIAKVGVGILDVLRVAGPCTDPMIEERCSYLIAEGVVPKVTPQRLRTVRSELTRRGLVVADPVPGVTPLGNKATRWRLA